VSFSQGHKSELQDWQSRKLEETLPDSVEGTFRIRKLEGFSIATLVGIGSRIKE
jgi:hypothetical protein